MQALPSCEAGPASPQEAAVQTMARVILHLPACIGQPMWTGSLEINTNKKLQLHKEVSKITRDSHSRRESRE